MIKPNKQQVLISLLFASIVVASVGYLRLLGRSSDRVAALCQAAVPGKVRMDHLKPFGADPVADPAGGVVARLSGIFPLQTYTCTIRAANPQGLVKSRHLSD